MHKKSFHYILISREEVHVTFSAPQVPLILFRGAAIEHILHFTLRSTARDTFCNFYLYLSTLEKILYTDLTYTENIEYGGWLVYVSLDNCDLLFAVHCGRITFLV